MVQNMEEIAKKYADLQRKKGSRTESDDKADSNGVKWYHPKDGANVVRFLPPVGQADLFVIEFFEHYKVGPSKKTLICLKSIGEKCPMCAAVKELYDSGSEEDKALAKEIRAKHRYRANVIDINNAEAGVQVYEFGEKIFEALVAMMQDPEIGDITDEKTGRAVTLTKQGVGRDTTYTVAPKINPMPLSSDLVALGVDLLSTITVLSQEEFINIMKNGDSSSTYKGTLAGYNAAKQTNAVKSTPEDEEEEPQATIPTTTAPITTAPVSEVQAPATTTAAPTVEQPVTSAEQTTVVPREASKASDVAAKLAALRNKVNKA